MILTVNRKMAKILTVRRKSHRSIKALFILLVERGTVGFKCFAQKHNAMTRPGLEPRPRNTITRSLGNCACIAHIIIRNRHGRFISQDK